MAKRKIKKKDKDLEDFKKEFPVARKIHFINGKYLRRTEVGNYSAYTYDKSKEKLIYTGRWFRGNILRIIKRKSLGFSHKRKSFEGKAFTRYTFKKTSHREILKLKKPKAKVTVVNAIYTKKQAKLYSKIAKKQKIPLAKTDDEIKIVAKAKKRNIFGLDYTEPERKAVLKLDSFDFAERDHRDS